MKPSDRDILVAYMQMCIEHEDWHGVSDAANDLRELDAYLRDRFATKTQHKET